MTVKDIRQRLFQRWLDGDIISGRGGDTIEIVGASFIADEESIFGPVNSNYVARELAWYDSQSLTLADFPGGAPPGWITSGDLSGGINSNYGWCLYSKENGEQAKHVIAELRKNPQSRRAVTIYTRPSMHIDATADGKQDFICTNTVQYLLRGDKLHCVVQMRSSDVVLGYRNDYAWQLHALKMLAKCLEVSCGTIYWQAGSLHIYERHFFYLRRMG